MIGNAGAGLTRVTLFKVVEFPPASAVVGMLSENGGAAPPPFRVTTCWLGDASSLMVIVPFRTPPAVGLKVTDTVHRLPAVMVAPEQLSVSPKSPAGTTVETCKSPLPVFFTVKPAARLVVPTVCFANGRLVVESVAIGWAKRALHEIPAKDRALNILRTQSPGVRCACI